MYCMLGIKSLIEESVFDGQFLHFPPPECSLNPISAGKVLKFRAYVGLMVFKEIESNNFPNLT